MRTQLKRPGNAPRVRPGYALPLLALVTGLLVAEPRPGSAEPESTPRPAPAVTSPAGPAVADSLELTGSSTLDDYRAYAEAHNPELRAARLRWQAASSRIPRAKALPDPQIGYSFEDMGGGIGELRHEVEISQMFPLFGKRELMGEEAEIMAGIEEQMYREVKFRLDSMIAEAYGEYAYLSREITVTEENLKLLARAEEVARARYAAGLGSQADALKAQVEMGMLEERIQSLRDQVRPVSARLGALINRPGNTPLPVPEALPEAAITVSDEQLETWLRENSPSLKAASLETERAGKAVELARKENYPDIMLGFGAGYGDTGRSGSMGGRDLSYMGMFSLNVPLWGAKNRAAVNEAKELRQSAEESLASRKNELASELQSALYRYRDSERKVRLFRDSLLPKARQSLAVAQRAFSAGTGEFLDLVDAQRTQLELELSLERARSDRLIAHAEVARLTGRERLTGE